MIVKMFATSGSEKIASDICKSLALRLPSHLQPDQGLALSQHKVSRFHNDEILVQVDNVRGKYGVIIHTEVPPVNDHLIELKALIDAIVNAHPKDLLLVFPYYPYGRADRKNKPRVSTMGQVLAEEITNQGVKRVMILDPHAQHIKHFFKPTADDITSMYLFISYLRREFFPTYPMEECILVFADAGSAKRYEDFAGLAGLRPAFIYKYRPDSNGDAEVSDVIGDVRNKIAILIDDEILTGNTAIKDAEVLVNAGAGRVVMIATHGVLNHTEIGPAGVIKRLVDSPIDQFIITDSIPLPQLALTSPKFKVISVAHLIAEAIKRTVEDDSLTALRSVDCVEMLCGRY